MVVVLTCELPGVGIITAAQRSWGAGGWSGEVWGGQAWSGLVCCGLQWAGVVWDGAVVSQHGSVQCWMREPP